MPQPPEIKAGNRYWVKFGEERLRVLAVQRNRDIPGWWTCIAPLETPIMAEEKDFESVAVNARDNSATVAELFGR
jgi:hypothetical protein